MARLLVQLKLRLLLNALGASTAARASFVVSTIFACLLAIGTFAGLALLRGNPASVDLTTVIFTLFAFGWVILPIFAFGLDGTLDPATLALYPLRTRPLAVGLLAASATGAWPVANVTARFWIYQRRDPGSLVFWAITAVIMVAVSISSIVGRNVHPGVLLASAIAGAWTVGWGHADSAGQTGAGLRFRGAGVDQPP